MKAARDFAKSVGSGVTNRSLDSTYNCIGMVTANRRAWIEPAELLRMLADDGYRRISKADVVAGDVVVYYAEAAAEPTHVGLVISKEPRVDRADWDIVVLSQWGADGEYFHGEYTVPALLGARLEYFSERIWL